MLGCPVLTLSKPWDLWLPGPVIRTHYKALSRGEIVFTIHTASLLLLVPETKSLTSSPDGVSPELTLNSYEWSPGAQSPARNSGLTKVPSSRTKLLWKLGASQGLWFLSVVLCELFQGGNIQVTLIVRQLQGRKKKKMHDTGLGKSGSHGTK